MQTFEEWLAENKVVNTKSTKKKDASKPKDGKTLGKKKAPVERAPHHEFGS